MIEAAFGVFYDNKIGLEFKIYGLLLLSEKEKKRFMGLLLFGRMVKKLTVMKIGNCAKIQILVLMKTLNMKRRT